MCHDAMDVSVKVATAQFPALIGGREKPRITPIPAPAAMPANRLSRAHGIAVICNALCTESYARLPPDGGRREGRLISFGSSRSRFCEFDSVGWLDISEEQKHKWAVLMAHHQAYAFLVLGKTIFI